MLNLNIFLENYNLILKATLTTLSIASLSSFIGLFFGTFLAIIISGKNKILNIAANLYINLIRSTPMLLQIIFFYILFSNIGINISEFYTAVIAIGLNSAAYLSQVIYSGIKSISKGQIEAAKSLGIKDKDLIFYIILPQAFKVIIPSLANEFITLIKDSSLASLIGVVELVKRGEIIISRTHDAISVYIIIGLIYLIINTVLSLIIKNIEKRLNNIC